jgi:hypothetical protein
MTTRRAAAGRELAFRIPDDSNAPTIPADALNLCPRSRATPAGALTLD